MRDWEVALRALGALADAQRHDVRLGSSVELTTMARLPRRYTGRVAAQLARLGSSGLVLSQPDQDASEGGGPGGGATSARPGPAEPARHYQLADEWNQLEPVCGALFLLPEMGASAATKRIVLILMSRTHSADGWFPETGLPARLRARLGGSWPRWTVAMWLGLWRLERAKLVRFRRTEAGQRSVFELRLGLPWALD